MKFCLEIAMIKMNHVTKIYSNGVKALDNIDIEIQKSEFVFLVGPTGAGKTTFLRMILREESPNEGQVVIDGRNIEKLPSSKIPYLRRNIGVVFQDFKLLKSRTVFDNVAFALRVMGFSGSIIKKQVLRTLDLVGLAHKKNMYPLELSGGEQQRVCIARSLVNNPAILLTDEPTGNLDPDISWEIMKVLLEINMHGTTVLVATHDKNIVNRLRKRVVALVDGRITKDENRGMYNYGEY